MLLNEGMNEFFQQKLILHKYFIYLYSHIQKIHKKVRSYIVFPCHPAISRVTKIVRSSSSTR